MSIIVGTPSGGVVALADLDVSHVFQGTLVAALGTDDVYQLATSDADVDHVNVEAVKGNATMRWLKYSPGVSPTWLANSFYVSPDGDDSNTGRAGSPKQTIYEALRALIEAGGGTLYIDDDCDVGGPVPDQGICLRTDNMPGGQEFAVPGFLQAYVPLLLVGTGKRKNPIPYNTTLQAGFHGGGAWDKPCLWFVGSVNQQPFRVENLQGLSLGFTGARVAVDYDRNTDGTIRSLNVTNATRTGTTTVLTVDLPAGIALTHAERTSNVTKLYLTNPGVPFPPFHKGVPVVVTSSDSDFPSGVYAVKTQNPFEHNSTENTNWWLEYDDVGADKPLTAITGTLQTHGCAVGDIVHLETANSHFLATTYLVGAVDTSTGTTVTYEDIFGDGNANVNDMGTMAHQERASCASISAQFYNSHFQCSQDLPGAGPGWDIGRNQAVPTLLDRCSFTGFQGHDPDFPRDERRMAGVYCYGGTSSFDTGASLQYKDGTGAAGTIYVDGAHATTIMVDVRRMITESNSFVDIPGLRVDAGFATSVYVADFQQADTLNGNSPNIILNGSMWAEVHRSGVVQGACVGGDMYQSPSAWDGGAPSPWFLNHVTAWADLRISGKHPAAIRAMGPVQARFKNIVSDPSSWVSPGNTITAGKLAPDGSMTAVQLDYVNGLQYLNVRAAATDGNTWEAGGRLFFSGWVNGLDEVALRYDAIFVPTISGATLDRALMRPGYTAAGWQYISGYFDVTAAASPNPTVSLNLIFTVGRSVQLWGLTSYYIGPEVMPHDMGEHIGTAKAQPRYLDPGESGTMDGAVFHADGGLIVGKSGAPGTVSMFNGSTAAVSAAGTGAFRYNAGTNKIQYSKNGGAWTDLV